MKYVFLAITYFCISYIIREEIIDLKLLYLCYLLMLLSNNPYVESIVEPFISNNQKEVFTAWV